MSPWHRRRSLGVWETQTKNQGTIESSIAARKTFRHREANCVNLATPTGCHCASQEPHWSDKAIKYINTQAIKEAIGLSQAGTKQPQLSGQGISILFCFFSFLFSFFGAGWAAVSSLLSWQRTNCDPQPKRRHQRSGESSRKARS